jgi:hypothetical protein
VTFVTRPPRSEAVLLFVTITATNPHQDRSIENALRHWHFHPYVSLSYENIETIHLLRFVLPTLFSSRTFNYLLRGLRLLLQQQRRVEGSTRQPRRVDQ